MHLNKPNPRHEKNRHHLVTFLCVMMAIALMFLMQIMYGPSHLIVWIAGICYAVVFVGRTIFVELGIRRSPSSFEKKIEDSGRKALRRNLGIVLLEDTSEEER